MFTGCEVLLPESLAGPPWLAAGLVGRRDQLDSAQLETLIAQLLKLAVSILFPLLAASPWAELSPLGSVAWPACWPLMLWEALPWGIATAAYRSACPRRSCWPGLAPRASSRCGGQPVRPAAR